MSEAAGPKTLLFVVSEDWYFLSHRVELARAARAAGWRVHVATRLGAAAPALAREGFDVTPVDLRRGSLTPAALLASTAALFRLFRGVRPDVVHNVALKTALVGTLAARLAAVPAVVNTLAGLGWVFASEEPRARALRPPLLAVLKRLFAPARVRLVVQNEDDRALFEALLPGKRVALVPGSGLDLARFAPLPEPAGPPTVAFAGRLLRDKGVVELVEALRLLARDGRPVRAILAGRLDRENPSSLEEAAVRAWVDEGVVEWSGEVADIREVWREAHLAVLPSYREGLPKALLEAAASARAMVATDVPGCRAVVRSGETGLLVPPRDPAALAAAIASLLDDAPRRLAMGAAARRLVERAHAAEAIQARMLALYDEALGAAREAG